MELKDYHQYVVSVDGLGCLTVKNCNLRKFNPFGCISLSSIPHLRKASIPLFVEVYFSSNDEKKGFRNMMLFSTFRRLYMTKHEIILARFWTWNKLPSFQLKIKLHVCRSIPTKQRNALLSHLDPYDKPRISEEDFVDNRVSPEKQQCCSCCVGECQKRTHKLV